MKQSLLLVLLWLAIDAHAATVLWYRSSNGDYIGQGQTLTASAPAWTITAAPDDYGSVGFVIQEAVNNGRRYYLGLSSATGIPLLPGAYEEAATVAVRGTSPGISFHGEGRGCNSLGRFTIFEAQFGQGGQVERFAANFEHWCQYSTGERTTPLFGEIRFNSDVPLTSAVAAGDAEPDAFALAAQSPAKAGEWVASNAVRVYGANAPVAVSISGGEYIVAGRPFTAEPSTAQPLETIIVRVRTPDAAGARQATTLSLGGQTATLEIESWDPAKPLSGLYFRSPPGEYIGQGQTRLFLSPRHSLLPMPYRDYGNGLVFAMVGIEGVRYRLVFHAPDGADPMPGNYPNATSNPATAPGLPGLNFSGESRGCQATGSFVIYEAVYGSGGSVSRFAADFLHGCENGAPVLQGEVRYNSTVPFRALAGPPNPGRVSNLSTRGKVLTGNDVMIGGFIIGGSANKTVVVRARGPSLTPLGVPNALANPFLQLFSGQTQIAWNDNWQSPSNAPQILASGFAPSNPAESAILMTLAPGPYTAIVSGVGGTTGVGLVEVFEVDLPEVPLVNIATRGQVFIGDDVMIGGFIIQGSGPKTVVVRARGPSLTALGVPGVLANPVLQLFSGQTQIAMNDDWQAAANAAAIQASGFAPADPQEAAILMTLQPGAYSAIVSGAGGTTGVAIVEVFDAD